MRWCLTQRSSQVVSCRRVSLWRGNNKPSLNGFYKLRAWFHVCLSLYLQTYQTLLSDTQFPLWFSLHFLSCLPRSRRLLRAKRRISLQFSPLEKMIPDQNKPSDNESAATQQRMTMQGVKHTLTLDLWDICKCPNACFAFGHLHGGGGVLYTNPIPKKVGTLYKLWIKKECNNLQIS